MLDLSKLTSSKGANLIFHFETDFDAAVFEKDVNLELLQTVLREAISEMDIDTGKDTNIHLLLNNQENIAVLDQKDFDKWESETEKNWYHITGPTDEQIKKYEGDRYAIALNIAAKVMEECGICLSNTCPARSESFNQEAFDKLLADEPSIT